MSRSAPLLTASARRVAAVASASAAVGVVATAVDWLVLVLAVAAGVPQRWAIVPAFVAGVAVQFLGNRRFAFGAHDVGPAEFRRQTARFLVVEAGTLVLTAVVYNLLREQLAIDYRASRLLAASLVYFGFSLPLWHWVFRRPASASVSGSALP